MYCTESEPPRTSPQQEGGLGTPRSTVSPPDPSPTFPTIRGVEIGIVVLVLIVWIGAIALFFNRWGKIRMLLPYQPDYKQEQLKVEARSSNSTP
ncbi:jg1617 [Pararge aegeria aegeria]|uniref:Jg1617 protein n=1 Tax=Pararge aegeria aegeria TaxID=348720 RepID=A0A8S4RF29_9NEOP|nr:jg1617 [Pararge aegeria aegeria]